MGKKGRGPGVCSITDALNFICLLFIFIATCYFLFIDLEMMVDGKQ